MPSLEHDTAAPELAVSQPHPGRTMAEAEFLAWCDEDTRAEWVVRHVLEELLAQTKRD